MHRCFRSIRTALALSLVAVYALSSSVVARTTAQQQADTPALVTGGGTIQLALGVASFGVNAKRPANYVPGSGDAEGRINYDRHFQLVGGRRVNVPVKYMLADVVPQGPNQTGGSATLVGDCTAPGAECPGSGTYRSVEVYVEDNSDQGAGHDVFQISFCRGSATLPSVTFPALPFGCDPFEGNTLRSGNIQIRAQ